MRLEDVMAVVNNIVDKPDRDEILVERVFFPTMRLSQKPVIPRLTRDPLKKYYLLSGDCGSSPQ